jgi:broad specificity phosphatase PhoE
MRSNLLRLTAIFFCCLCFSATSYAEDQRWYFVRHFEKMSGPDPELTKQGTQRAQKLADYFAQIPLTAVYSTNYHRTKQTAQAVASELGLPVTQYDPRQLATFAETLKLSTEVLVVGHSNTTPGLIDLMGGQSVLIEESDYGQLFIVRKVDGKISTEIVSIPHH